MIDANIALQIDAPPPLIVASTVDSYCLALSQLFAPKPNELFGELSHTKGCRLFQGNG